MSGFTKAHSGAGRPALAVQTHTYRESWLAAAADVLRAFFAGHKHPLPERINYAVAFPSTGSKGKRIGEHWDPAATKDGTHTIIIRADLSDPVQVLDVLVHELCHAAAPAGAKHGPKFRAVAEAVGLTGRMTSTVAGPELQAYLQVLAGQLGPLPHSPLMFARRGKVRTAMKTQKCVCELCGYNARVPLTCIAEQGPPLCPVDRIGMEPGGKFSEED